LPLALVGLWLQAALALVLFGVIGVANTVVDVTGYTLLQRTADDAVLARVFGVLHTLVYASVAVGGSLAPVLISLLGEQGAFVAVGLILPALALVSWRPLARVDRHARARVRELGLLQGLAIFAPLPGETLERLANDLRRVEFDAGETIVREGEPGHDFFVVAGGRVEVSTDGASMRELGPGECFGEIALLRDVPRTATVTVVDDAEVYALDRDHFVAAVSGHAESSSAADALVTERLGAESRLGFG
jgi:hypothetical protein